MPSFQTLLRYSDRETAIALGLEAGVCLVGTETGTGNWGNVYASGSNCAQAGGIRIRIRIRIRKRERAMLTAWDPVFAARCRVSFAGSSGV